MSVGASGDEEGVSRSEAPSMKSTSSSEPSLVDIEGGWDMETERNEVRGEELVLR